MQTSADNEHPTLFFDDECVLCNGSVDWLLRVDRKRVFRYAPLRGDTAATARAQLTGFPEGMGSFVFVDGDRVFTESSAAFAVASRLPFPWRALSSLRVFPRVLTDAVYRTVARNRVRWFGRSDKCRLPTPDEAPLMLP